MTTETERVASAEEVERVARAISATRMKLQKDPTGANLPRDLWEQSVPHATAAIAAMRPVDDEVVSVLREARAEIQRLLDRYGAAHSAVVLSRIDRALSRSAEPVQGSLLGRDAKLNELILLAMVAAANEQGSGYDQAVLKRHADHAAGLWADHIAVQGEVTEAMVKAGLEEYRNQPPGTINLTTIYLAMQSEAMKAEDAQEDGE